jgi:Cu/Ag efflux protein CusF
MKKLFLFLSVSLLALATAGAQTQQAPAAKQQVLGEITAVDASAHTVTVRSDAGETVTLSTNERTTYTLLPAGVTDLQKGARVTFAEVRVGDRVLAPGVPAAGGPAARLILMTRAGGGPGGGGQNAGRRLNGRVVSVDAAKRQVVVQTRGGREGQEPVTVDVSGAARVLRYAPDSMRPADAVAGSLADVRVGENIRATGERSADGATFKAEEVLTGSFARFVGSVASADAQRNELVVKTDDGGSVRLSFGARSSLRRITPEFEQALAKQRAEAEQRREQRRAERQQQGGQAQGEGAGRREGEGGRRQRGDGQGRGEGGGPRRGGFGGPGGGGNNQMFDSLPAVTLAELKKGDAVVVTVTPGADASHATVISLVTGPAETIRAMRQFQRGGDGPRGMSPGLPGDVIGGGQGPTREPPR